MHWSEQLDELAHVIGQPRFGLISDFDGTLSPFVGNPIAAQIVPENGVLLDALAEHITVCALVSGRAAQDLRARFERPHFAYFGNHGMEYWAEGEAQIVELARAWIDPLNQLLDIFVAELRPFGLDGVFIENKRVSASVHYRQTDHPAHARDVLYALIAPLCEQFGFQLSTGQFIWEIKPPIHVNKGTAVRTIVEDYQLDSALFLGDDVTDFAGMIAVRNLRAERPFSGLSVGVVHHTTPAELFTHCDVTANGIDDITELLRWILHHLTQHPTR